MLHMAHVALWSPDIERLKTFYQTYFQAQAGEKYVNPQKQFSSYFLRFPAGPRLELMSRPDVQPLGEQEPPARTGYAHVAFSVGSVEAVDELTARLRAGGYQVLDGPRRTGDGYYESVVLDPDGNRVEITS